MLYKRYNNKLFSQNVRIILTIISECDFKSYYYARMSEVFLLFFRNVRINSTILSECRLTKEIMIECKYSHFDKIAAQHFTANLRNVDRQFFTKCKYLHSLPQFPFFLEILTFFKLFKKISVKKRSHR